jgi:hypothetical protein
VLSRASSTRTGGTFERLHEAAVEVLLESLAIEADREVRAGCRRAAWSCEEGSGKRNGITHGTADSKVELTNQRDMNQRGPRDSSRHSTCPRLHPWQFVMGDEVVGPFLRRLDRNRSYSNAIESHYKFLFQ